jgi:hypothetical protein
MASPDPPDRHAYLEEQIERQKRGEPIDVDWVKNELERVRREQAARLASSQRNLRWLVIGTAALLLVLWAKNGGFGGSGGFATLGLILVGLLAVFGLSRRRRG